MRARRDILERRHGLPTLRARASRIAHDASSHACTIARGEAATLRSARAFLPGIFAGLAAPIAGQRSEAGPCRHQVAAEVEAELQCFVADLDQGPLLEPPQRCRLERC